MSLLDNLSEAESATPSKKPCTVARSIHDANLSDAEDKRLQELMFLGPYEGAFKVPTTHLARAIRKSGISVSDKSLERHRKRDCSCYR